MSTNTHFLYSVVDAATDSTTVNSAPTIVRGVYINTTITEDVVIKDGTTSVATIPANTPAGSYRPLGDALYQTSLVVDPGDTATGNLTVYYKDFV